METTRHTTARAPGNFGSSARVAGTTNATGGILLKTASLVAAMLAAALLWTGTAQAQETPTEFLVDMAGNHHTLSEGCDNPDDPLRARGGGSGPAPVLLGAQRDSSEP